MPVGTGWCRSRSVGSMGQRVSLSRLEYDETGAVYTCVTGPSIHRLRQILSDGEKHRFVWIWPGEPALADPALIPTCTGTTIPIGPRRQDDRGGNVTIAGRRQSDGSQPMKPSCTVPHRRPAVAESPFEANHSDRFAYVTRWMHDIDPPPSGASNMASRKVDAGDHSLRPCTVASMSVCNSRYRWQKARAGPRSDDCQRSPCRACHIACARRAVGRCHASI